MVPHEEIHRQKLENHRKSQAQGFNPRSNFQHPRQEGLCRHLQHLLHLQVGIIEIDSCQAKAVRQILKSWFLSLILAAQAWLDLTIKPISGLKKQQLMLRSLLPIEAHFDWEKREPSWLGRSKCPRVYK